MSIVIWLGGERSELTIQSLQQRWGWETGRERENERKQKDKRTERQMRFLLLLPENGEKIISLSYQMDIFEQEK
jgi:hypothetical protein